MVMILRVGNQPTLNEGVVRIEGELVLHSSLTLHPSEASLDDDVDNCRLKEQEKNDTGWIGPK